MYKLVRLSPVPAGLADGRQHLGEYPHLERICRRFVGPEYQPQPGFADDVDRNTWCQTNLPSTEGASLVRFQFPNRNGGIVEAKNVAHLTGHPPRVAVLGGYLRADWHKRILSTAPFRRGW